MRGTLSAVVAILISCSAIPALAEMPDPMDALAFDMAAKGLGEKARRAWAERMTGMRPWNWAPPTVPLRADPLMEMWAQRIHDYTGAVKIDTKSGNVDATVKASMKVTGKDHKDLYFITYIPVTKVTDESGADLTVEATYVWGLKLTHVALPEVLADGAEIGLTFTLSGKPDCNVASVLPVKICGFAEGIAYLASDLFLPGSVAGDFATLDLLVTVPAGNVVTTNGMTVSVEPAEDPVFEVHHVVQAFPTEARSIAIGPYVAATLPWGKKWIRVNTLADPAIEGTMATTLTDIRDILNFYSARYGEFLFPKMEASQILDDAGAAFGWPTLLWIPKGMLNMGSGKHPEAKNQRTALYAHELGHQWFPDLMKMGDGNAAWLSEGWAEFSSVSYMNSVLGNDYDRRVYAQYSLLYRWFVQPYADYGLTSKKSAKVTDAWVYQLVTYYKGAMVTNTIRQVMGDDAFLAGVKKMHGEIAGKDVYYVTEDLKGWLEEACGKDLGWLFDQWVYNPGWPSYTVTVSRVQGPDSAQEGVKVAVERGSNTEGLAFSMPVRLALVTDQGEELHEEQVDKDEQSFSYVTKGRFLRLRFDPTHVFIKRVTPGFDGDADLSGDIDGIDLIYAAWGNGGAIGMSWNYVEAADFDYNGAVNDADLAKVVDNFGKGNDEVTP